MLRFLIHYTKMYILTNNQIKDIFGSTGPKTDNEIICNVHHTDI